MRHLNTSFKQINKERYVFATITILSWFYYMLFVPDVTYWLDAPEFVAGGFELGYVHPPGHPLLLVLLKGFDFLPLGNIVFRSNLISGFFMGLCSGLLGLITLKVLKDLKIKYQSLVSIFVGLAWGTSMAGVLQGIGVEVYSLNAFIEVLAIFMFLKSHKQQAYFLPAAFIAGLGLANHHYLTVLMIPVFVVAAWPLIKKRTGLLICGVFIAAIPLLLYLYLPIRYSRTFSIPWTDIRTARGLFDYISARTFASSVSSTTTLNIMQNIKKAMLMVSMQATPLLLFLALLGIASLLLKKSYFYLTLIMAIIFFGLSSKVIMSFVDPFNPDAHGYFLVAYGAFFVLSGLSFTGVDRLAKYSFLAVFVVLISALILGYQTGLVRRNFHDTDTVVRYGMRRLPVNSLVIQSFYQTFFLSQYAVICEGLRPDSTFIQGSLSIKSGGAPIYLKMLCKRDPDACSIYSNYLKDKTISWNKMLAVSRKRPIAFEPIHGLEDLLRFTNYDCYYFLLGAKPKNCETERFVQFFRKHVFRPISLETKRFYERLFYLSAKVLLLQGRTHDALVCAKEALSLNPHDEFIRRLYMSVKFSNTHNRK